MTNFSKIKPIVEMHSEDSLGPLCEEKRLDPEDPWLFFGEDEDFINAA